MSIWKCLLFSLLLSRHSSQTFMEKLSERQVLWARIEEYLSKYHAMLQKRADCCKEMSSASTRNQQLLHILKNYLTAGPAGTRPRGTSSRRLLPSSARLTMCRRGMAGGLVESDSELGDGSLLVSICYVAICRYCLFSISSFVAVCELAKRSSLILSAIFRRLE